MKNCNEVRELILLYIDGELDDRELQEFESHIDDCDECKKELNEIKTVIDMCRDIDEVELPENFRDELHEKLVQAKNEQDGKSKIIRLRNRYIRIFSAVAAGLLLVVFGKGFYDRGMFAPVKSDMTTRNEAKMEAPQAAPDRADTFSSAEAKNENKAAESSITAKQEAAICAEEPAQKGSARSTEDEARKLKVAPTAENIIVRSSSEIVVNAAGNEDLDKLTDKIKAIASENGAEFNEAVGEANQASGVMKQGVTKQVDNGADVSTIRTLNFKVPSLQYERFVTVLTESFGQSNVQVNMNVEDLTGRVNELNSRLADLNASIGEAGNNAEISDPQKLDAEKAERDAVEAEIERVELDSDYTFINMEIRENNK